jgi:hypothetical protein
MVLLDNGGGRDGIHLARQPRTLAAVAPQSMTMLIFTLSVALCASSALAAQSETTSKPAKEVANIRFHSDELMNLHHTLYAAAWARRPEAGTPRALAGRLPAPLDTPMTAQERAAGAFLSWEHPRQS